MTVLVPYSSIDLDIKLLLVRVVPLVVVENDAE